MIRSRERVLDLLAAVTVVAITLPLVASADWMRTAGWSVGVVAVGGLVFLFLASHQRARLVALAGRMIKWLPRLNRPLSSLLARQVAEFWANPWPLTLLGALVCAELASAYRMRGNGSGTSTPISLNTAAIDGSIRSKTSSSTRSSVAGPAACRQGASPCACCWREATRSTS